MENRENNIKLYTTNDLMDMLHIGRDRAYALMKSSSFPSMQIGKTFFVESANLRKWLNDNTNRRVAL